MPVSYPTHGPVACCFMGAVGHLFDSVAKLQSPFSPLALCAVV